MYQSSFVTKVPLSVIDMNTYIVDMNIFFGRTCLSLQRKWWFPPIFSKTAKMIDVTTIDTFGDVT